jgi:hypothetical protein
MRSSSPETMAGFTPEPAAQRERDANDPPTFCLIREVSLVDTPDGIGFAVTVADQEGTTARLALQAHDLVTYERFQAAVWRETGCPFRYRPWDRHRRQSARSPSHQ